jgi:tetratricopeptide (TPR) repeat protein
VTVRSLARGGFAHPAAGAPSTTPTPAPGTVVQLQLPSRTPQAQRLPHRAPLQVRQNQTPEGRGRTATPPTSSVQSLATGRIPAGSFACGTLHDCEDPSLYFEDGDQHGRNVRSDPEVDDLIVKLSSASLPRGALALTRNGTCPTSADDDTLSSGVGMNPAEATDSVIIFDPSRDTFVEEFIHPPHEEWQGKNLRQSKSEATPSTRPASNSYSYQHVIAGFLKGSNPCPVDDDAMAKSLVATYTGHFDNRNGQYADSNGDNCNNLLVDCYVNPAVASASTGRLYNNLLDATETASPCPRTLMVGSAARSLFVPAYDDGTVVADDDADETENAVTRDGSGGGDLPASSSPLQREVRYWKRRLDHATKHHGRVHPQTAEASFNLGHAQLRCLHYDPALENLTHAHAIWRSLHRGDRLHLSVGRALDGMGLCLLRSSTKQRPRQQKQRQQGDRRRRQRTDSLREAQRLLEQAFAIRCHHLGVWHVDTVETYNRLASVRLHLGDVAGACHAYQEVFHVRRAIFGRSHPSVAISAHSVANCHYRLGSVPQSLQWYQRALDVYEAMGLAYRHPAVARLLKDRSRLEQYLLG